ncbi:hypothetical protein [Bremerella cremea]|uniref:hypothetical protein n=1 Tax=Bremerella cremea TaxID=1031537 RepID=UPI0031EFDCB9
MFAILAFVNLCVPFTYEDRFFGKKLIKNIRSRTESYIERPTSTTCQLVAVIPEDRWTKPRNRLSDDIAIMWTDPYSSQIFLEGDRLRYHIPIGSLLELKCDHFRKHLTQVWYVHLTFRTADGPHELFLRPGENGIFLTVFNRSRQASAEQLFHRIELVIAEAKHRQQTKAD